MNKIVVIIYLAIVGSGFLYGAYLVYTAPEYHDHGVIIR